MKEDGAKEYASLLFVLVCCEYSIFMLMFISS